MLKADIPTSTRVLTDLFQNIWNSDTIPEDPLLSKFPRKATLRTATTGMSVPSKVFCRVLLNRMETAIDTRIRQEQAGFRKGRGFMDQMFAHP